MTNTNPPIDFFSSISDPRVERTQKHSLESILFISLCAVAELTDGEVVAIDGKCMRGSSDEGTGTYPHLVSAWASANNLLLAQEKVAGKSNEITAIPGLLRILELKNCIVTIDAMGCQREIAKTIIERGADYILALKGNQPEMLDRVSGSFTYIKPSSEHTMDGKRQGPVRS